MEECRVLTTMYLEEEGGAELLRCYIVHLRVSTETLYLVLVCALYQREREGGWIRNLFLKEACQRLHLGMFIR